MEEGRDAEEKEGKGSSISRAASAGQSATVPRQNRHSRPCQCSQSPTQKFTRVTRWPALASLAPILR